ncbi:MAG: GNAT family N-acetyltransferase, partial [Oscillospiraceae bacterium]|nr:GNAT family N-acetyltransferase [Oscillospiraceae bacterium]
GMDCLLTVPAQPSLFHFFAKCGFSPAFYMREVTAQPAPAPAVSVTPMEYAALREGLLAGVAHTAYSSGQLAFQQNLCPCPGSGLYCLELAHGPGCAAVENWPGAPVVKELLCAPGDAGQGAAACAALCGAPVRVRVPAGAADGQPFAAIRWLEGTPASVRGGAAEGWLGLAFD